MRRQFVELSLLAVATWCVIVVALIARAAEAKAPAGRFSVKSDSSGDVVVDATFNRTWQRATAPGTYDWSQAKTYCGGLQLQGGGWRLPDLRELLSLVDIKISSPAVDKAFFADTFGAGYWTATAYQPSASSAWIVVFNIGYSNSVDITNNFRVRCVR